MIKEVKEKMSTYINFIYLQSRYKIGITCQIIILKPDLGLNL
jgi:hypothetical protein